MTDKIGLFIRQSEREKLSHLTITEDIDLDGDVQGFFLSSTGDFGTGGGWADAGFINDVPVTLFGMNVTERTIFMNFAALRYLFDSVDPVVKFATYSTGAPVVTTGDDVRWQLEATYFAIGDVLGKPVDETLLTTQTLETLTADTVQNILSFTLDRTLISTGDIIKLTLSRLGADVLDTYADDIAIGQSGLLVETKIFNP